MRVWIFTCLLTLLPALPGSTAILLDENWSSGQIAPGRWMTNTTDGEVKLVVVGPGDYCLAMSNNTASYQTTIYSKSTFTRGENLECIFRVWHNGSLAYTAFNGPWHYTTDPTGKMYPVAATIEAGIDTYLNPPTGGVLHWFESGDKATIQSGPPLSEAFNNLFSAANDKSRSILLRIALGDTTGATGYYSTDNGALWHPFQLADATSIDTREKQGGTNWNGIVVSDHTSNYIGFGPGYNQTIYIDDIRILRGEAPPVTPTPTPNPDQVITSQALVLPGQRFEATVPATLDLAERAQFAFQGLIGLLHSQESHAPYGQCVLNVNPPYMSQLVGASGRYDWGDIAHALLLNRRMCGAAFNQDQLETMLQGMLRDPTIANVNLADPSPTSRAMLALMTLYRRHPSGPLRAVIERMANEHHRVTVQDGIGYYSDPPAEANATIHGVLGYRIQALVHGTALMALTDWYNLSGDGQSLYVIGLVRDFLKQERFWQPEAHPKALTGFDHAHFAGDMRAYADALLGLLEVAAMTHDTALLRFVREGYEYLRNFGLARIGAFGEACVTATMIELAIRLSTLGVADYWEDVDQYVRNHLSELQMTDETLLQDVVDRMPVRTRVLDPLNETDVQVLQRTIGRFFSDAGSPGLIHAHRMISKSCCQGRCAQALYRAWDAIVQYDDGTARVNLLLNRASPWLDVDSYLPYQGKVVIRNRTATRLFLRLPRWVKRSAVECRINQEVREPRWITGRLYFDLLQPGDRIQVDFPMASSVETYTLKWKEIDYWMSSTYPGSNWSNSTPALYTMTFKGNTLVDITPRSTLVGYPLYQRDDLRDGAIAPMMRVTRYVPVKLFETQADCWSLYQ